MMTYSNPQYQIQSYATLPSTNKKLKELLIQSEIDEFTVIITDDQTSGRGQQNRITSYNVCYTKLLRLYSLRMTKIAVYYLSKSTIFELL